VTQLRPISAETPDPPDLLVFGKLVDSPAGVLLRCWRVGAGEQESFVSTSLQVIALVLPTVAVILATVFLWLAARRRQTQVGSQPAPDPTPADPTTLDSLLSSMSQRLAATEGRLGAMAAELQQVAILNSRVAAIETNMPGMQEAYEKYSDSINRADKRATERARVETKTQGFQTAGEAAADLAGAAGAGGIPALTQPVAPKPTNKRAGLLGSGGRNRR